MHIPVPPIIDAALFETIAEQVEENRLRARVSKRGARYLLQGLLVWARYAGMLMMANRSVQVRGNSMSAATPIIAASAQMPIASAECDSAGTSNCERTWWMKGSGKKSVGC
jgi:hypothetical protein